VFHVTSIKVASIQGIYQGAVTMGDIERDAGRRKDELEAKRVPSTVCLLT